VGVMTLPIERLDAYRCRIPAGSKSGMTVPAIIFADEKLLGQIRHDLSLEQAANAATLPGVVRAAYAMPDIHQGYGLPIGAVVATRTDGGVVTPGGVGYDINCGVRLLRTELTLAEVLPRIKELVNLLFAEIPTGVGSRRTVRLSKDTLNPESDGPPRLRWRSGLSTGKGKKACWIDFWKCWHRRIVLRHFVGRTTRGGAYRPNTTSIPESTKSRWALESFPVRSFRRVRSTATICETLATDSFGNPVWRGQSGTLPGARA
jgi:hypothetical protein